jgi:hypothetical protein
MDYDDLTEEQQEIWDKAYEEGYDLGFDSGMEAELSDTTNWDDGYTAGFEEGVEAEQRRIQFVLKMMFDSSLNMGHGNKAVQYKHAMDLLRPIKIDYSEEAYQKGLEDDGF